MRTLVALFFLAVLGLASQGNAHDANFAAIKVIRQPSNIWSFELKTPLYELDRSMRRFNAERSRELTNLAVGTTRYKELIVEYIKATFKIDIAALSDRASPALSPALGSGRIKLGDHESVLVFTIKNMPAVTEKLTLHLPFMANNPGQHNILWLIDNQHSQRHILSEGNRFTVVGTNFFDDDTS